MLLDFPALVGGKFAIYIRHQHEVIGFHAMESLRVTEALAVEADVPNNAPMA